MLTQVGVLGKPRVCDGVIIVSIGRNSLLSGLRSDDISYNLKLLALDRPITRDSRLWVG